MQIYPPKNKRKTEIKKPFPPITKYFVIILAVQLKISGYARVLWTERGFYTRRTYDGREDYLATTTYLMGSENSEYFLVYIPIF